MFPDWNWVLDDKMVLVYFPGDRDMDGQEFVDFWWS